MHFQCISNVQLQVSNKCVLLAQQGKWWSVLLGHVCVIQRERWIVRRWGPGNDCFWSKRVKWVIAVDVVLLSHIPEEQFFFLLYIFSPHFFQMAVLQFRNSRWKISEWIIRHCWLTGIRGASRLETGLKPKRVKILAWIIGRFQETFNSQFGSFPHLGFANQFRSQTRIVCMMNKQWKIFLLRRNTQVHVHTHTHVVG